MAQHVNQNECQFASLKDISQEYDKVPPAPFMRHIKLFIRRHISPDNERILYKKANAFISWFYKFKGKNTHPTELASNIKSLSLKEGELVRVKSREEIMSTLDHLGKLKGCSFMEKEMSPYCGTVHRVHKSMERFVDERELRVKKCKGLILLEDVMCQGTTEFGRCDRSCYVFWREEWLERVEEYE